MLSKHVSCSVLRSGRSAENCHQPVCLSMCLSVSDHISGTAGPIGMQFYVRTPVGVARPYRGLLFDRREKNEKEEKFVHFTR